MNKAMEVERKLGLFDDPLCVVDTSITIPLERYNELIRKEVGYDYRRAELQNTTYITPSTADKVMFQLEEKTPLGCEAPVDDDF